APIAPTATTWASTRGARRGPGCLATSTCTWCPAGTATATSCRSRGTRGCCPKASTPPTTASSQRSAREGRLARASHVAGADGHAARAGAGAPVVTPALTPVVTHDAAVPRAQEALPGLSPSLPPRRLLRALLRGCSRGCGPPPDHADLAAEGRGGHPHGGHTAPRP